MHDKKGNPVKEGDKVMVEGVIEECYTTENNEFCNVRIGFGKDKEHGPLNVHGTLSINSQQCELLE